MFVEIRGSSHRPSRMFAEFRGSVLRRYCTARVYTSYSPISFIATGEVPAGEVQGKYRGNTRDRGGYKKSAGEVLGKYRASKGDVYRKCKGSLNKSQESTTTKKEKEEQKAEQRQKKE